MIITAIIDTGSSNDVIRAGLVEILKLPVDNLKFTKFVAADGISSQTLGQTRINFSPLSKPSLTFTLNPQVSSDLPVDLLIGMETLLKSEINLNLGYIKLPLTEGRMVTLELEKSEYNNCNLQVQIAQSYPIDLVSNIENFENLKLTSKWDRDLRIFLSISNDFETVTCFMCLSSVGHHKNCLFSESEQTDNFLSKVKLGQLDENQHQMAMDLLNKYSEIFQVGSEISLFKKGSHPMMVIPLTTKRYSKPAHTMKIPQALYKEWGDQLRIWIDNNIVEEQKNQVPYIGSFIPVKKRDGGWRFAYDARSINSVIEDEHLTLPAPDEMASNLSGRLLYSSVDLASFYLNFSVHPDSRDLLSFFDPLSSKMYRFRRSVFGLKGSAQMSINLMTHELAKIKGFNNKICSYVDDISLSANSFNEMLKLLKELFEVIKTCCVKLKASKCEFFMSQLDIFGFKINKQGMTISESRAEALKNVPIPNTKKGLLSHLASFNYFRTLFPTESCMSKFFNGFSDVLKSSSKFKLLPRHLKLWRELHTVAGRMIIRNKLLASDKEVILRVDSSQEFFGYILSVKRNEKEYIITTGSKVWTQSSRNWHITRLELCALLEAVKTLNWALINRNVTLVTDNAWVFYALKHPEKINIFEPSLISRKLVNLSMIDYTIIKATNKSEGFKLIDSLSRSQTQFIIGPRNCEQLLSEYKSLRAEQPTLLNLSGFKSNRVSLCGLYLNSSMRDSKLFQELIIEIHNSSSYKDKNFVDEKYRIPVVMRCHHLGHIGVFKINHILSKFNLSWPNRSRLVNQVVNQCDCQKFKAPTRALKIQPGTVEANRPFQILEVDVNSIGTYNPVHLLVAICPYSKYILAERISGQPTSKNILNKLFEMIARYCPQIELLRCDNASYFKSPCFSEPLKQANIHISYGSRHNSRSMSNCERANRYLNEQLRYAELSSLNNSEFNVTLQSLVTRLNCSPSPSRVFTPFELIFGVTNAPFNEVTEQTIQPQQEHISHINHIQQLHGLFLNNPNENLDLFQEGDQVRIRANPKLGKNKITSLKFTEKIYQILDTNRNRGTYKIVELDNLDDRNPQVIYCHHRFVKLFKTKDDALLPKHSDLPVEFPTSDEKCETGNSQNPEPVVENSENKITSFSGPRRSSRIKKPPKRFSP